MLLLSTVQVTTRQLVLDSQKRRPGFCFTAPQLLQLRDLLRNRRLLSASIVSVECSFPPSNGQMATKQNQSRPERVPLAVSAWRFINFNLDILACKNPVTLTF